MLELTLPDYRQSKPEKVDLWNHTWRRVCPTADGVPPEPATCTPDPQLMGAEPLRGSRSPHRCPEKRLVSGEAAQGAVREVMANRWDRIALASVLAGVIVRIIWGW